MKIIYSIILVALLIVSCKSVKEYEDYTPDDWARMTKDERITITQKKKEQDLTNTIGDMWSKVLVKKMEIEIPENTYIDELLWKRFYDKELHESFSSVTNERWPYKWRIFSFYLCKKAKEINLDSEKLSKLLDTISPKVSELDARLPYEVFFIIDPKKNKSYWVIACIWENDTIDVEGLGHIWICMIDNDSGEIIEQVQCD